MRERSERREGEVTRCQLLGQKQCSANRYSTLLLSIRRVWWSRQGSCKPQSELKTASDSSCHRMSSQDKRRSSAESFGEYALFDNLYRELHLLNTIRYIRVHLLLLAKPIENFGMSWLSLNEGLAMHCILRVEERCRDPMRSKIPLHTLE